MPDIFITGVEQNSDKIFVTAGLAATMQSLGYSVGVYKPVGVQDSIQSQDLTFINYVDPYVKTYFSYMFKSNSTPILAAAAEGVMIEPGTIIKDYQKVQNLNEILMVDGTSGLASPYNKNFLEEDLIKILGLPVIYVVEAKPNSINNILLSVNRVKGDIILNNCPCNASSDVKLMPKLIEEYTDSKVLGVLPELDRKVNPNDLILETLNGIDIEAVFNLRIAKLRN